MTTPTIRRAIRFHAAGIFATLELDDGTEIDLHGCVLAPGNKHNNLLTWLSAQLSAGDRYDAARLFDPSIVEPGTCDCSCDVCRDCRDK